MSEQFTYAGEAGNCSSGRGSYPSIPILRNSTGTPVCGIQIYNASDALTSCCDGDVQTYWCNSYCETQLNAASFEQCYLNNTNQGSESPTGLAYCQSGISSTYVGSSGDSSSSSSSPVTRAPSLRLLTAALLLLGLILVTPASASAVHSLDGGLTRRATDASACTFAIQRNYTTIGTPRTVSDRVAGGGAALSVGMTAVSVGGNNRTLNGSDAADPRCDAFFEVVGNLTGRRFPAMTGLSLTFEWVTAGSDTNVQFTPALVSCCCPSYPTCPLWWLWLLPCMVRERCLTTST